MIKRESKGKRNIIILSSIILLSFVLMTINIRSTSGPLFLEKAVGWVVAPIQSVFTKVVSSVSGVFRHYFFLANVAKENELLKQDIDGLRKHNNELIEQILWQNRVGGLMEYKEQRDHRALLASVVGRDATQWSKEIFINKGTQQGVKESMAVVTNAGVVGHITQALATTSKVLLINDSRSAVDALFQETRVSGVVAGTGQSFCDMKYVPISAKVEAGDMVLSSGLGGIFPKGLVVGTVTQVKKKKHGLFQEIAIAPKADLARLEEVLVLLP